MKQVKAGIARLLTAVLIAATVFSHAQAANAASKKPALSASKKRIARGKTATLKLKNAGKYKASWKTSKKNVVSITKKTKTNCTLKALKKGTAVITCNAKKGKQNITLKCKVTVYSNTSPDVATPTPVVTDSPTEEPTAVPTKEPTPTPIPTAVPTKHPLADESILENYKDIFGNVGTCLPYYQMENKETMEFVKKHYNSFTMENEMKPDAMLRSTAELISVSDAKNLGYSIPDNYKEKNVPKLNLESLDNMLQAAHDNGLRMRGHTLLWHSQTPAWFFTEGYNGNKATDPDTMDARLEFYIRTVMKYAMDKELSITGETGSILYAWDVVNEYLNRYSQPPNWTSVYGDMGDSPSYVKKAFEVAYDVLKSYGATNKVVLFYNDYNTYFNTKEVINLVDFINENEPEKICGGIGMQSHIDIRRPTVKEYGEALDQFFNTGLEVQITELDITINFDTDGETYRYKNEGETNEDQAVFVRQFMDMLISKQLNRNKTVSPKGITGITLWGLYDRISWRASCKPLLFGKNISDPKPSFYQFIEAAKNASNK